MARLPGRGCCQTTREKLKSCRPIALNVVEWQLVQIQWNLTPNLRLLLTFWCWRNLVNLQELLRDMLDKFGVCSASVRERMSNEGLCENHHGCRHTVSLCSSPHLGTEKRWSGSRALQLPPILIYTDV